MRHKNQMLKAGMGAVLLMGALAMTACTKSYKPAEIPTAVSDAGGGAQSGAGDGKLAVGEAETDESEAGLSGMDGAKSSVHETALMTETAAPSFKEANDTVYVTGDKVNLRVSASPTGEVFAKAAKGTALKRSGTSDTWSKVVYQGQECYISTQYVSTTPVETAAPAAASADGAEQVKLDPSWKYAEFSKIHTGTAMLYRSEAASKKGITVCVNAGHGTKGGSGVKTQCHPDGTAKVTGGTTGAGATTAVAVSGGMQFNDGTTEAEVTLAMAKKLKEKLLAAGYDVLMIRESDDVQLDNIARTVIANNKADCHVALHWDSTNSNKGAFYMSVPNVSSYRNMEPVKSNWKKHDALGDSLVAGLKSAGVKIFSKGNMETDLTQTSFSTIPSVDIELGDKASDHSDSTLNTLADGLLAGINQYFGK